MESQQIRSRSVDERDPEGVKAFAVEILQELAAQVADLNENLKSTSMACERIANQMEKNSTLAERKSATTREEAIAAAFAMNP